jgi:hypothetical protein
MIPKTWIKLEGNLCETWTYSQTGDKKSNIGYITVWHVDSPNGKFIAGQIDSHIIYGKNERTMYKATHENLEFAKRVIEDKLTEIEDRLS